MPRAESQLNQLDDRVWLEAMNVVAELEESPFPPEANRLRGWRDFYRIPFYRRQYRMIYHVDERRRRVQVSRISHRSGVYRGLDRW